MDVFDELFIGMKEDDRNTVVSFEDFSSETDNAITSEQFQLPMLQLEPRYSYPHNSEAIRIWNQCNLYEVELKSRILRRLYKWAIKQNLLRMDEDKQELLITWISPSATVYSSTWNTFQKWFLCACRPV